MKSILIAVNLIILCFFLPYYSLADPTSKVIGKRECNSNNQNSNGISIEYQHSDGILIIEYRNVIYNCCMEEVQSTISVIGDKITIVSEEGYGQNGPCDCLCPFDIQYEIKELLPNQYVVTVDNTKAEGRGNSTQFTIDLSSLKSGKVFIDK
jgi:hypothetical protein